MSSPRFRFVADVGAEIAPLHPAVLCIGPGGDLWMIADDRPPSDPDGAEPEWPEPHDLTILNFREGVLSSSVLVANPGKRSFVQPLGADEVLLVAARTAGEPNARVVDVRGATVREFILGDGIEDVQTTNAGEVWVSYYDEGTFMGCWTVQGPPDPIPYFRRHISDGIAWGDGSNNEHCGLLRTTNTGEVSWRFTDTETIEPILWCDGLNVFGDGSAVWACYSIFPGTTRHCPVVRIGRDGTRRVWDLDGDPGRALAVHDETILLGGGYGDPGSMVLGRLGEGGAVEDVRYVEGMPDEEAFETHVIGRGPVMHRLHGTRWYVLDLRD